MRWNCPHCGSNLAVSDEKMGTGWSFSRCYKCGGFALVRRSDVNLVKVDRAPPGEPVLLPEANEDPTALLSKNAAQNLARYTGIGAAASTSAAVEVSRAAARPQKPVVRPAARRTSVAPAAPPAAAAQTFAAASASSSAKPLSLGLPEPLPEEPTQSFGQRLVPMAIVATGTLAIASGIYLYVQGQALWEKARIKSAQTSHAPEAPTQESPQASQLPQTPAQNSAQNSPQNSEDAIEPPLPAGNEVVQAPSITPDAPLPAHAVAVAAIVPPPLHARSTLANLANPADLSDEVHANAMAPNRAEPVAVLPPHQIQVELLTDTAHIHSGPGMSFPVVGSVTRQRKYAVEEWRDRWFKIKLENPEPGKPAKLAWIRNDLVRLSP